MFILETRCHPPSQDSALIHRDLLSRLYAQLEQPKLVVLKAPAGYGKTTTMVHLHQYMSEGALPVVWLSLDEFDGSWHEAWRYLHHVLMGVCPSLLEAAPENPLEAEAEALLCNALIAAPLAISLFLDDLHAIAGTDAERFIGNLIKRTIGKSMWVIGSRFAPGFALAKWRSSGLLLEVEVDALRFSCDEVSRILSLVARGGASEKLVQSAYVRTEGWPAALKMVSIALHRTHDEQAFVDRLSGSSRGVASFFGEEVFDRLEPEMQSFLLHTSVLGRLCPGLCNALTQRVDGGAMLQSIEATGLFIFSLDDVQLWYRYHHLFADFLIDLLRERDPAMEPVLHRRACDWFAREGFLPEAIQHAFRGGDKRRAAELLESAWGLLNERGLFSTTVKWAAAIPADVLEDFPTLQMWRSWYLMCERRLTESANILAGMARRLDGMDAPTDAAKLRVADLRRDLLHKRLMFALHSDDVPGAEELYRELLKQANSFDQFHQCSIEIAHIYTRREQFNFQNLETLIARADALGSSCGKPSVLMWLACITGPALMMQGKSAAALALYRQVIEVAERLDIDSGDFRAMPVLLSADLMVEHGNLDEALVLFERASALGSGVGLVDHLVAQYVTQARLASYQGDVARATELLNEGFGIAASKSLERLRLSVVHERIRQALARGRVDAVRQLAADAGLPHSWEALCPSGFVTTHTELKAMIWARVAIATGQHEDAIPLLRQWLAFVSMRGAVTSQIRIGLLLARAQHVAGDSRAAIRTVREAIKHAALTGMTFVFQEEGQPIRSLLAHVLEAEDMDESLSEAMHNLQARLNPAQMAPPSAVASMPSAIRSAPADEVRCEALSAREVEILGYVSRSLLNKEIAHKLGLTEGSVKWYMQQIYGKLGVRRRMAALEKARTLGYL